MAVLRDEVRGWLVVAASLFLLLGFKGQLADTEDFVEENMMDLIKDFLNDKAIENYEKKLDNIDNMVQLVKKQDDPKEQTETYNSLVKEYEGIIKSLKENKDLAALFHKANGLQKVVVSVLDTKDWVLKSRLLELTITLFEADSATTNAVIPKGILHNVLDIVENEEHLGLKDLALKVLLKWLPNNPAIQMKVMKLKGLELFYLKIDQLDMSVIKTLLNLFNTIIKEHIEARSNDNAKKIGAESLALYKKIGILEHLENSNACKNLVDMFATIWTHKDDIELVSVVFELINNTKPYCEWALKGRKRAISFIEQLQSFANNASPELDEKINATHMRHVLNDYVDFIVPSKIEL